MKPYVSKKMFILTVIALTSPFLIPSLDIAGERTVCASADTNSPSAKDGAKVGYKINCLGQTKNSEKGHTKRLEKLIKAELKKKTPSFDNIMTKLPNRDRLQLTPEQIASIKEDPKAALKQAIIDYSGKADEIEKLSKAYKLSKQLYNLDPNELKEDVIRKTSDLQKQVSDYKTAGSALNVAYLRCSTDTKKEPIYKIAKKLNKKDASSYLAAKEDICTGVQKLYEMKQKVEQLQAVRENGYSLKYSRHKQRKKFKGGRKRHMEKSLDLRWYPDVQGNYEEGNFKPTISIDNDRSWFQWSSEDVVYLADLLNQESDSTSICDGKGLLWFRLGSRIKLRVKITDVTSTNAEIGSCVAFKGYGSTKHIKFPTVSVPAPYGYLAELTEMKDDAVQNLMDELKDAIINMLPVDQKLEQIADIASKA